MCIFFVFFFLAYSYIYIYRVRSFHSIPYGNLFLNVNFLQFTNGTKTKLLKNNFTLNG